jgi:hypothetical protein
MRVAALVRLVSLPVALALLALAVSLADPPAGVAASPPIVESVEPNGGPTAGGTSVTIRGLNFFVGAGLTVRIGNEATTVDVKSETEITAKTAATAAGSYEVVVSDVEGTSSGGPSYTYLAPPRVTLIEPTSGPTAGGTVVEIKGAGFRKGDKVKIGSEVKGEFISSEEMRATTVATAAGADEVVVIDAVGGSSSGGPSFTFQAPPKVTSVSPPSGTPTGGTVVTIKGTGFIDKGVKVKIGCDATAVAVISEAEITAETSACAAGHDEVIVSDARGSSSGGPSYTYVVAPPPQVTSIEPASGPTTGATAVTIEGSGFAKGAKVTIGGEATSVLVHSETEITASTAAGLAGPEEVIVSDASGVSTGGPSYTYVAPPAGGEGGTPAGGEGGTLGGGLPLGDTTPLGGVAPGAGVLGSTSVALPAPVLGHSVNVALAGGVVLVEPVGGHALVPLTGAEHLSTGSILDATDGTVTITTAAPHGGTQTGQFFGGEFVLSQGRGGMFVAVLTGGDFAVCPTARERGHLARASATHASGRHVVRKLWANAHGSFSTKGNYAAGAVAGTEWLTEDLCDGTLIRVTRDKVAVTNLVTHRHFLVKVGHSYLAKAP